MTIPEYIVQCHSLAREKGFYNATDRIFRRLESNFDYNLDTQVKKAFVAQRLMLTVSELAEAMEADRKDLMDNHLTNRTGLEVELADTVIRIFDLCGWLNIDLESVIDEKLAFNSGRPYLHGDGKTY